MSKQTFSGSHQMVAQPTNADEWNAEVAAVKSEVEIEHGAGGTFMPNDDDALVMWWSYRV